MRLRTLNWQDTSPVQCTPTFSSSWTTTALSTLIPSSWTTRRAYKMLSARFGPHPLSAAATSTSRSASGSISQSDLVPEYKVPGVHKGFQMMCALPFVPIDDMDRAWRFLKSTLPSDLDTFARYFESIWIGTSATEPLFDQCTWNQYEACKDETPAHPTSLKVCTSDSALSSAVLTQRCGSSWMLSGWTLEQAPDGY